MKCGDEEWQHCQVEKMGCRGCYYDENTSTLQNEEEITLDDYVLTNININTRGYVVRLKDGKEYQIYRKKPRGQKTYDYIIKDEKEIRLSKEVRNIVLSEIREYERYGI